MRISMIVAAVLLATAGIASAQGSPGGQPPDAPAELMAEKVTGRLQIRDEAMQTFTLVDPKGVAAEAVQDQTLIAPAGTDLSELDGEEVTVSIENGRVTRIDRSDGSTNAEPY